MALVAPAHAPRDLEGMTGYTTRQVAEILGLTEERVRSFARAGASSPARAKERTRSSVRPRISATARVV